MEKEIFNGKIVRLVSVPQNVNGETVFFEKVFLRSSVHIFPFINSSTVRIVKEHRFDKDGSIQEKIPAGIIEASEEPLDAAKRELKEELGLTAKKWQQFMVVKNTGTINDVRYYFLAHEIEQDESSPDKFEEIVGYADYSITDLFEEAMDGHFGYSSTAVAITKIWKKYNS